MMKRKNRRQAGFSLIEVLIGVALIGMALLGLAQLFLLSVFSNSRAEQIANGTFLARQAIDQLRILESQELAPLVNAPIDEELDLNNDNQADYRRIIWIVEENLNWKVRVWVFPGARQGVDTQTLVQNPRKYGVLVDTTTVIR